MDDNNNNHDDDDYDVDVDPDNDDDDNDDNQIINITRMAIRKTATIQIIINTIDINISV
jgi:hypothetical protein